jgi:hypothetical protein
MIKLRISVYENLEVECKRELGSVEFFLSEESFEVP